MNTRILKTLFVIAITAAPFAYAAWIWGSLPESIPVHFGADGQPDHYGSKGELLLPVGILMVVGLGVYALFLDIEKIDPKKSATVSKAIFRKLGLTILIFMSGISLVIVQSAVTGKIGNVLFLIIGLLFAAMGNLMHSIKPNYFAGFRLPWTLENEENWRRTHLLGGKLWFVGGLAIAFASLLIPGDKVFIFLIAAVLIISVVPIVYSYLLFRRGNV